MAQWQKTQIQRDNEEIAEAQAPVIISASRSTDIPAFYADWFFHRLKVGYSAWTNPFNGVKSFISYEKCRFIVFWSKNPKPLLEQLDYLEERHINCYIQYTLNDYQQKKGNNVYNKAHLTRNLKHKFRDTFLYRYCENKLDRKVVYVCLTNFDDVLNGYYKRELQKQLPTDKASRRWSKFLLDKSLLFVVNMDSWHRNFEDRFGQCKKIL